jgi:hypothetical protein
MSGHAQNVGLYNAGPPETILVYSSIQQRINGAEKPIPSQILTLLPDTDTDMEN